MSAIGWVMIANSSNCLISQEWLASVAEGDSIINATLLISHLLFYVRPLWEDVHDILLPGETVSHNMIIFGYDTGVVRDFMHFLLLYISYTENG